MWIIYFAVGFLNGKREKRRADNKMPRERECVAYFCHEIEWHCKHMWIWADSSVVCLCFDVYVYAYDDPVILPAHFCNVYTGAHLAKCSYLSVI